MPVSHSDMQDILKELGCRTIHQVKKVVGYMLPDSKEAIYLHRENQLPQLVVRPALEVFSGELAAIDGVFAKEPYYHNADMTRFPKRLHGGKSEVHYGLAYEFDDRLSVEQFISKVASIVSHS